MYPSIRSTEIMAYHDIGKTKWKALGMDYSFPDLPSASPEQKRKWEKKVEIALNADCYGNLLLWVLFR